MYVPSMRVALVDPQRSAGSLLGPLRQKRPDPAGCAHAGCQATSAGLWRCQCHRGQFLVSAVQLCPQGPLHLGHWTSLFAASRDKERPERERVKTRDENALLTLIIPSSTNRGCSAPMRNKSGLTVKAGHLHKGHQKVWRQ